MSDQIPFFLHEAVMTLYPQQADGSALTSSPLWWGGLANRFRSRLDYEEVKLAASGDTHQTAHHVDEEHILEVEKSWLLRKTAVADFFLQRNQQYVLSLVWQASGHWYRRDYYGVTGRSLTQESQGTNQFLNSLTLRAQRFTQSGGTGAADVFTPLEDGDNQPIPFFRESPLIVGEYLLGHYRWPVPVTLDSARLIAWNSLVTPTVLTLEVNGVLTAKTITIPVGTPNAEVTVDVDLADHAVPAGQSVRWKVTSAPSPENAAWMAAVVVQVRS